MIKRMVYCALLFLFCNTVCADSVSDVFQARMAKIKTMSATFSQVVTAKKRVISRASGTMALARPGRFRWQTARPIAQLIIADGQKLWIYDKDLEQVTVSTQGKEVRGTAGLFLSDTNLNVTRDFTVTYKKDGNEDSYMLQAKSTKSGLRQVQLTFAGDELTSMELFDELGQTTAVQLRNIKMNLALSASLFHFKTPRGVDVITQ